jgi:hypothetical protein
VRLARQKNNLAYSGKEEEWTRFSSFPHPTSLSTPFCGQLSLLLLQFWDSNRRGMWRIGVL